MTTNPSEAQTTGKYANVNGIKMYYEIHGSGSPLVLIHGGGSTIKTNFSRIMPVLAKTTRLLRLSCRPTAIAATAMLPKVLPRMLTM
jgi:pimeloyl-ACP methyl ester carboxylesterase